MNIKGGTLQRVGVSLFSGELPLASDSFDLAAVTLQWGGVLLFREKAEITVFSIIYGILLAFCWVIRVFTCSFETLGDSEAISKIELRLRIDVLVLETRTNMRIYFRFSKLDILFLIYQFVKIIIITSNILTLKSFFRYSLLWAIHKHSYKRQDCNHLWNTNYCNLWVCQMYLWLPHVNIFIIWNTWIFERMSNLRIILSLFFLWILSKSFYLNNF